MIELTHALGLKVIAEGVETSEQLRRLRNMKCDFAQGNYFSEPLPSEALAVILQKTLRTEVSPGVHLTLSAASRRCDTPLCSRSSK